jgi:hypothetical protein
MGSNGSLKGRARREALEKFECDFLSALENRGKLSKEFFQQSRIIDFFWLAANFFEELKVHPRRRFMILFSDMLQVDERRNWEKDNELRVSGLRIKPIGGEVAIYCVQSSFYQNAERWESVHKIWVDLLSQSGITVVTYSSTYPK